MTTETKKTPLNRYRILVLVGLNVLILVHVWAWFILGWRGFGHSDPREFFVMMGTGAIGIGAILLVIAVASTAIAGRAFCGWGCHMGSWQEVTIWIQTKLGIKREILHSRLTFIVPIAMIILWCIHYGVPQMWQTQGFPGLSDLHMDLSDKPPFVNTNGVSVSPVGLMIEFSIIVFALPLFFGSKAVCRYICPFAPFFRAADKIALFRLRAVNTNCDDCNECNRVCLMGIDVLGELKRYGEVRDSQCIKCMTCVDSCHTDTIKWTWRSAKHWAIPRTEPKRAWFKRQAPFLIDLGLAGLVVAVFLLLPWETLAWVVGDGENFMLLVPLVLFGGVLLRATYLKWKAKDEPKLVQIGGGHGGSKLPILPIPGGLPKKVQNHKRSRKWNSLGRGGG